MLGDFKAIDTLAFTNRCKIIFFGIFEGVPYVDFKAESAKRVTRLARVANNKLKKCGCLAPVITFFGCAVLWL